MARDLTKVVIVDLECTCWEKDKQPLNMQQEIIEFGICTLHLKTLEVENLRSLLVKPEYGIISSFCSEMTSLTQEQVEKEGMTFRQALTVINTIYKPKDRVWASYGDFDRVMIDKQLSYYARPDRSPFGKTHWNLKNMFAVAWKLDRELGMDKALECLNLPLEGHHHRGVDDVKNIAKIATMLVSSLRNGEWKPTLSQEVIS